MKIKAGVKMEGVQRVMYYAMGVVDTISQDMLLNEAVVTSGTEGEHMKNSLHYVGLALDFRTQGENPKDVRHLFEEIGYSLKPYGFDVVLEKDHIHVEFDPKGKELFGEAK